MLRTFSILMLLATGAAAQVPPPPPAQGRDPVTDVKPSAVMRGRVRTPDGRPVRRAQVSLRSSALPEGLTVGTGIEGEFEATDLPAGRYNVTASRSGFLTANYGQRGYGEPGSAVEITSGATVENIDFTLERAAVISGRVVDESGDPVANATVWAMQRQFFQGKRRVVPISHSGIRTDDMGLYRLTPLPPGDYAVVAMFRETWMSDGKERQMLSYAPSYYPAATNAAEAARVKVAAGQEAGAIDIALIPGRAASISGTVTAASGAPLAGASLGVEQETMGPGGGTFSLGASGRAEADGTWRLRDVPPGEYMLRATGNAGDGPSESASLPIVVTGNDIEGIALAADAGGLVAGVVVTDSGVPLPARRLQVAVQSPTFDRNSLRAVPGEDDGVVGGDGKFSRKAAAGPALVRVFGAPSGWFLKSVSIGQTETTDSPVDIRPGAAVGGVTIVMTNRLPAVTGRVVAEGGQTGEGTVILFPAAASRWFEAAGSVRAARGDQAGKFRFDNVRPGEYLLIALDHVRQWQIYDPEFLEPLRERATKLTVGDEAPAAVDLKVVK